ncbi:MAG: cysteine desulfurase [Candidatus Eisenbacteria bacterium]|uniref:Cysteine desulfurase n=1 Tax=Eiseniibacteriota bacterium TaxID=2212470 RepID=A0A933SDQ6_UNCEI|nr:cysteine desulfurase [Candidatus Eisenbacteria bacterium]
MKHVYADHAATTRPAPEAVQAMLPYVADGFGNPSSVHTRGEAARDAVEAARIEVARLMAAQPEEIVFTASGSESNNLALKGVAASTDGTRRRIVVSAIEHPSVLATAKHLEARGHALTVVPVQANGRIDPDELGAALGDDVALVSVMALNNETGVTQPLEDIGARVKACGALFHVDAVQAPGKLALHVDGWNADLVSIAAHKFGGVPGAAALFVRRRTRLVPLVHGGRQERGRRAGTENVPAIVAMGAAAVLARTALATGEPARLADLGERLLAALLMRVADTRLNGDLNQRAGGILNVCFAGVDGEAALHELDRAGVIVSTGSACSSGEQGPSHVLTAMGLTAEDAHASVRFSLGRESTAEDVEYIAEVTPPIVERLRALSGPALGKSA